MKTRILEDRTAFNRACAEMVLGQMRAKKDAVIGLSTGRTTGDIHREIARLYKTAPFDISGLTFFEVDEVVNVPLTYSGACYTMIHNELLDSIGVGDSQFVHFPTKSDDFARDCAAVESELASRGGIDFIELGLGENGHLAFNQPGSDFKGKAGLGAMYPELEERIRRETAAPSGLWLGGVGLGIADIMSARKIMLAACGASKASAVEKVLRGPVTEDVPGRIMQYHQDCELILDKDAASKL